MDGSRAAVPQAHLLLARCAFVVFCLAIIARVLLGDATLNQYYHYSTTGGNLAGKIHPSNYMFVLCAALMYAGPGFRFRDADLPVLRAILIFGMVVVAVIFPGLLRGQTGSIGYVLDTYIFSMLAAVIALAFPYGWRIRAAMIGITTIVFNAAISIGEYGAGRYVVPYDVQPAEFRPGGLIGFPLTAAVINMCAALFLLATRISLLWRISGVLILLAGIVISGARTSMLVTAAFLPIVILLAAHARQRGMSMGTTAVVMLLAAIVLVPIAFMIVSELGFLKRFSGGLVDDSAKTRVEIFKVFGFVGWRDILFGGDVDQIRRMALQRLGIQHIESPIVTFVFNFGLPMTIAFLSFLAWLFYRLARNTNPAIGATLLAFLIAALSNNTLSTKVPSFFIVVILTLGMRAYFGRSRGGA